MTHALSLFCLLPAAALAQPRQVCRPADPELQRSCAPEARLAHTQSGSRGATDLLGRGAWLIDEENDEVLLADHTGIRRRVKVGAWPEQVVAESSGRVFVSCREAGRVDVIGEDFEVQSIPVGPEPRALALDEQSSRLYVGTVTGKQLVAFDTRTLQPLASRAVGLPLSALAVTPLGLAAVSDRDASVTFYPPSLDGEPLVAALEGPSFGFGFGAAAGTSLQPQWLVMADDDLFVVTRMVRTGLQDPSSGGGYGGSVSGPHQVLLVKVPRLSQGLSAAALMNVFQIPDASGVALAGGRLSISSASRGLLMHANPAQQFQLRQTFLPREERVLASQPPVRQTVPRPASTSLRSTGVAAMAALDADWLLVLQPHRRELALVRHAVPTADDDLGMMLGGLHTGTFGLPPVGGAARTVAALPESRLGDELHLGRAIFHDAENRGVSQRGMSCSHCHPDGREDGLVWEQNATLRQTPMLAGGRLAETAPYNWQGTAKTLEANIHQTTTQRLLGTGLNKIELAALSRYVREGLRPVQRPEAPPAVLVALGREVFESAATGCATCHPADFAFTDGEAHDVKSVSAREHESFVSVHGEPLKPELRGFSPRFLKKIGKRDNPRIPLTFNTPALAYLAVTGPYLHDGSARTLGELLERNHDRMGATSQLSDGDRQALVAYLQSL